MHCNNYKKRTIKKMKKKRKGGALTKHAKSVKPGKSYPLGITANTVPLVRVPANTVRLGRAPAKTVRLGVQTKTVPLRIPAKTVPLVGPVKSKIKNQKLKAKNFTTSSTSSKIIQ